MPNLYIISGCNGAGKITASFTILPEMLDCEEFINRVFRRTCHCVDQDFVNLYLILEEKIIC